MNVLRSKPLSLSGAILILANFIPIFGVLFLGWNSAAILLLYWAESVVIGLLNIPKILLCRPDGAAGFGFIFANAFVAAFFTVHYGIFTFVHGVFVMTLLGGAAVIETPGQIQALAWAVLSFLLSHLFSLFWNYMRKEEYRGRTPNAQMGAPYGRVFIMHFVIIFGGFLAQTFGEPIFAVLLLIAIKTVIDYFAHTISHTDTSKQVERG